MIVRVDETKGSERWLPCIQCDNQTKHLVLCSARTQVRNDPDGEDITTREYEVVQCQGCETISSRHNWKSSLECSQDWHGDYYEVDHEELFPSRVAGRRELKDAQILPPKVRSIYIETQRAVCNKLRVLAGIGIRALVEAVCRDRSAEGRDLEKKIDDLVRLNVLTVEGAEILHGTRLLGNLAAHECEALDETQLVAAMDVAEYLLVGTYVIPKTAANLPKRKAKLGNAQSGAPLSACASVAPVTAVPEGQVAGSSRAAEDVADVSKLEDEVGF